jgi:hypothetical protein
MHYALSDMACIAKDTSSQTAKMPHKHYYSKMKKSDQLNKGLLNKMGQNC